MEEKIIEKNIKQKSIIKNSIRKYKLIEKKL